MYIYLFNVLYSALVYVLTWDKLMIIFQINKCRQPKHIIFYIFHPLYILISLRIFLFNYRIIKYICEIFFN